MPTEAQIEAACSELIKRSNEDTGDNAVWPDDFSEAEREFHRSSMRAVITAVEAAELWSEGDADLIEAATDMLDMDEDWSELSPVEMDRLLHLARCGAGRA